MVQMADVAVAALSVSSWLRGNKREGFEDAEHEPSKAMVIIAVVAYVTIFFIIPWAIAFYIASSCADAAVNFVIAFLFPVMYIIVWLLAPCQRKDAYA